MAEIKTMGKFAGFADEFSFHAEEHAEFLQQYGLAASVRWISFEDSCRIDALNNLEKDDFNKRIAELKASGDLIHVTALSQKQLARYAGILSDHDVSVWDIGSAVGKDTQGQPDYKDGLIRKTHSTILAAKALNTKRARIFSTYPDPKSADPSLDWNTAVKDMGDVLDLFQDHGLVGYIEIETELIAQTGYEAAKFIQELDRKNVVGIHDAANCVRIDDDRTDLSYSSFVYMLPVLGALHFKDAPYSENKESEQNVRDEAHPHVVIGKGAGGYDRIIPELGRNMERIGDNLEKAGLERRVGLILEPHLKFQANGGGISHKEYHDAVKAAKQLLDASKINYN